MLHQFTWIFVATASINGDSKCSEHYNRQHGIRSSRIAFCCEHLDIFVSWYRKRLLIILVNKCSNSEHSTCNSCSVLLSRHFISYHVYDINPLGTVQYSYHLISLSYRFFCRLDIIRDCWFSLFLATYCKEVMRYIIFELCYLLFQYVFHCTHYSTVLIKRSPK